MRVDVESVPFERGGLYFFSKRLADENQSSLYMRSSLHGADVKLIDGNTLSADGNTSVALLDATMDGAVIAYGVRVGGADEMAVHFLDVASRKDTWTTLPSARYYGIAIAPDKKGVYYSKFFPGEGTRVLYHAFGTALDADPVIFGREYHGEKLSEIDNVGISITDNALAGVRPGSWCAGQAGRHPAQRPAHARLTH
jgi:prolyl oligopeptidase